MSSTAILTNGKCSSWNSIAWYAYIAKNFRSSVCRDTMGVIVCVYKNVCYAAFCLFFLLFLSLSVESCSTILLKLAICATRWVAINSTWSCYANAHKKSWLCYLMRFDIGDIKRNFTFNPSVAFWWLIIQYYSRFHIFHLFSYTTTMKKKKVFSSTLNGTVGEREGSVLARSLVEHSIRRRRWRRKIEEKNEIGMGLRQLHLADYANSIMLGTIRNFIAPCHSSRQLGTLLISVHEFVIEFAMLFA